MRHIAEVEAVFGNTARTDQCGGNLRPYRNPWHGCAVRLTATATKT
jgi:hypothetical protein